VLLGGSGGLVAANFVVQNRIIRSNLINTIRRIICLRRMTHPCLLLTQMCCVEQWARARFLRDSIGLGMLEMQGVRGACEMRSCSTSKCGHMLRARAATKSGSVTFSLPAR